MATYQKIEKVEARKYDGPKITVVSHSKGEQTANAGDYLIGTEPGKVTVLPAAQFEAEYQPYSTTPQDDQISADAQAIAILKAELATEQGKSALLTEQVTSLTVGNQALLAEKEDTDALKAQVTDLTAKLAAAQNQATADEAKLQTLTDNLQSLQDAQAKSAAAQAAVQKALES